MIGRRHLVCIAVAVTAIGLAVSGCGGSSNTAEPAAGAVDRSLFSYNASQKLDYRDRGRANDKYAIEIRDITYSSRGGTVEGFLAIPPGGKRLPAVVYVHGSGGSRLDLLVQATWLAARGAIALAITAPSSSTPPRSGLSPVYQLGWQRELTVRDVVAVRRAVDLLQSLPRVDPKRIGYTGFSAGARLGAFVAAVEPRISALALMSGGSEPVSAYVAQAPQELKEDVQQVLAQVDPLAFMAEAKPGTLLLLDGRKDEVVPKTALDAFADAAPDRTTVRWYDAGHILDDEAWRDQLSWMAEKLGIEGPPVPGAKTGP
jgi:dienelactone hydrolase